MRNILVYNKDVQTSCPKREVGEIEVYRRIFKSNEYNDYLGLYADKVLNNNGEFTSSLSLLDSKFYRRALKKAKSFEGFNCNNARLYIVPDDFNIECLVRG